MAILGVCLAVGSAGAAAGAVAGGSERAGRIIYLFRDALWSANPDGSGARPITRRLPVYAYGVAPDGAQVAFAAGAWRGGRKRRELVESAMWVVDADGAGLRRIAGTSALLHGASRRVGRLRWSLDGRFVAFDVLGGEGHHPGGGLYVIRLPGGTVHDVARGAVETFAWTPDGQIRYRQAISGGAGHAEWLVSPAGTPHPHPAAPEPGVTMTACAAPPGAGDEVSTVTLPLPPGAIPAPEPTAPLPGPAAVAGRPPLGGSEAGAD